MVGLLISGVAVNVVNRLYRVQEISKMRARLQRNRHLLHQQLVLTLKVCYPSVTDKLENRGPNSSCPDAGGLASYCRR
jgi:hypothetical protein